jgi:ATP synthase protein I
MYKIPIYQAVVLQGLVMAGLATAVLVALGAVGAYSVLLGGLISIIPGAYFAFRVFMYTGARSMEKMVRNAYFAELIKLIWIGAGFALVFRFVKPLQPELVFGGFAVIHLVGMVAVGRLANRKLG